MAHECSLIKDNIDMLRTLFLAAFRAGKGTLSRVEHDTCNKI